MKARELHNSPACTVYSKGGISVGVGIGVFVKISVAVAVGVIVSVAVGTAVGSTTRLVARRPKNTAAAPASRIMAITPSAIGRLSVTTGIRLA